MVIKKEIKMSPTLSRNFCISSAFPKHDLGVVSIRSCIQDEMRQLMFQSNSKIDIDEVGSGHNRVGIALVTPSCHACGLLFSLQTTPA